jgi:predicted enzyme related to lactoylglutathione lyase
VDWKLEVVVVPVSDVDRAKAFYSEKVGFAVDLDHDGGGMRVVQLTPPGSACSISLGPLAAGPDTAPLKGLQLVVPDVTAAREELAGRGVDVSPGPARGRERLGRRPRRAVERVRLLRRPRRQQLGGAGEAGPAVGSAP